LLAVFIYIYTHLYIPIASPLNPHEISQDKIPSQKNILIVHPQKTSPFIREILAVGNPDIQEKPPAFLRRDFEHIGII
jgi:hypothetical protein